MPVNNSKTAVAAFRDIQPGDIFFTTGMGLVGSLIRRGTSSPYAHCGVVVAKSPNNTLTTHEAFGDLLHPLRPAIVERYDRPVSGSDFAAVQRLWRDEDEQEAIIRQSRLLYNLKGRYDWSEIAVMAVSNVLPHAWIPNTDPDAKALVCSHHVAWCLHSARPLDYANYIRYAPWRMWPGGLAYDIERWSWNDARRENPDTRQTG